MPLQTLFLNQEDAYKETSLWYKVIKTKELTFTFLCYCNYEKSKASHKAKCFSHRQGTVQACTVGNIQEGRRPLYSANTHWERDMGEMSATLPLPHNPTWCWILWMQHHSLCKMHTKHVAHKIQNTVQIKYIWISFGWKFLDHLSMSYCNC